MNNLMKSPLFWIGAVIGVRWLYKNKPDSKLTRVFEEIEEGATNLAYQTADYASDIIDTGAETLEGSAGALGWNMQDGDTMPGMDADDGGEDTNGGGTNLEDDDASTTPGDDTDGGAPFTGRRNPVSYTHLTLPTNREV